MHYWAAINYSDTSTRLFNKTDRQCTFSVTLRRVGATIVAVEEQWILHILSVCVRILRHPEYNAHAPYCHLWSARPYNIFTHYLIKDTIFEKKVVEHKTCVFSFLQCLPATFLILRGTERDTYDQKRLSVFMYSTFHSCPILIKIWIFSTGFRKIFKYQTSRKSYK